MKDYSVLDKLVPKTEELHRAIFDEGYTQGYTQGYIDGKAQVYKNPVPAQDLYQRGLEDAWHVFERVVTPKCNGGLNYDEVVALFNSGTYEDIVKFSPMEAVKRLKAYEGDITVGDEVNAPGFHIPVVVVALYDDSVKVMSSFGDTGIHPQINVTKTGRHFPEIAEVFKAMQEGKE